VTQLRQEVDPHTQHSSQEDQPARSGSVGVDTAADDVSTGSGTTLAPEPYVLEPANGPLNSGQLQAVAQGVERPAHRERKSPAVLERRCNPASM
jgi:hypothetical protein